MGGIVIGNMAIAKMIDAYSDSLSERNEMFSTGEIAFPGNIRAEAGKWYRATYPNGPLSKRLRIGQVVTVAGFLVIFALLAI